MRCIVFISLSILLFIPDATGQQTSFLLFNRADLLPKDSLLFVKCLNVRLGKVFDLRSDSLSNAKSQRYFFAGKTDSVGSHAYKKLTDHQLKKQNSINSGQDSILNDWKVSVEKFAGNTLNKIDSISGKANNNLSPQQQKLKSATSKSTTAIGSVQDKLTEKLRQFNGNGGGAGQLNLFAVSGVSPKETNPLGLDTKRLGTIPNLDLSEAIAPLPDISNIDLGLDKISVPNLDRFSELTEKIESMGNIGGDVTEHVGKASDLTAPDLATVQNLPTTLESQLAKADQMKTVSEQIESVPDYVDMTKKWNSDPEVMKEMALSKAKETAVNHFAGHEEELKSVMEQLSKYKSKIPGPEGIVDLYSKHKNLLRDKSFVERLVPGFTMQFQREHSVWLDLNPYVTFKISGRFATGIGWNERLAYDFKSREWDDLNRIYGPRMSLLFKVKENLWLKAEIEGMRGTLMVAGSSGSDVVSRRWIVTYFGGIKKDFQISKVLKGHIQMMYNVYDPNRDSPYTNKLNVRMGVDLPLKKRFRDSAIKSKGLGEI